MADIARMPHVKSVAPRLSISGLISRHDATLAFLGGGIDPALDITAGADNVIGGRPLDATKPRTILVGEGLAASLEVKPGDNAVLLVNLPSGGINATDVVVGGIFRTASKVYDDAAVRVPLALARELLKTNGADVWIVTLDQTERTEETLAALRADPTLAGLEFTPWTALADFYNKAVVLYARQFAVMKALIAIIIVLSIMNTMMMSVSERTWEIGTMMAIGTPRTRVLRMFLSEGLVLGVIGGIVGVALGFAVNTVVSAIGIPMPPAPGMRHGFVAQASFGSGVALSAFALAVVTTTIASIAPAFAASRLVIVDALRAAR
jgi:putative ABC transport system permease protein